MRKIMEQKQYTLVKLPIKEIISQNFDVKMNRETEMENEYLVAQSDSLLFDQIERLRGRTSTHISEVILVVAKKNPNQENELKYLLENRLHRPRKASLPLYATLCLIHSSKSPKWTSRWTNVLFPNMRRKEVWYSVPVL